MTKLSSGIYRIENLQADKRYFGQSVTLHKREGDHFSMLKRGCHDNPHFQNAWNKYGDGAFKFSIMIYCEPFELTKYEQFFVNLYPPEKLYNICRECVDSRLGVPHSAESRAKISKGNTGKVVSEESRAKISTAQKGELGNNFGKLMPENTRLQLMKANTNRHPSEETKHRIGVVQKGELNHNFGKHHSDETLAKMSEAGKKRLPASSEARAKMSMARIGKCLSEETCAKMSVAKILYWKNKKEGG